MKILNLACGTKTSADGRVQNLDWSIYILFKTRAYLRPFAPLFINGDRWRKFCELPDNLSACDLRRGIPYPDNSVDVVYHSHFLEHLDRDVAPGLLRESLRVLRPGGIHRIVVPDFEAPAREYVRHLDDCLSGAGEQAVHDHYISGLLLFSVLREATGTSHQSKRRRWLENKILGDARKRGHTHQWMYDRVNLPNLLKSCGYDSVVLQAFNKSDIPDWSATTLDLNRDGTEYKPGSLYIEARKPL